MKKIKVLEICTYIILLVISLITFVLVYMNTEYKLYSLYITLLCSFTMVFPIVILLFTMFKEAKYKEYTSNDYDTFTYLLMIIFGVGTYLIVINALDKMIFDKYAIWFYSALPFMLILPIIIGTILKKKNNKTDGPKFIKNK